LKEPASKAYDQVFAAHHSWTIRKAVSAGMFMLPTKAQFLKKLHEEGKVLQLLCGHRVHAPSDMYATDRLVCELICQRARPELTFRSL
jgi:hypothetical protein